MSLEEIAKSRPHAYFNGDSKGEDRDYGGEDVLYLSEN